MSNRRLIVGLGNPGPRYERTRHNMGFMAVDAYAAYRDGHFRRSKFGQVAELSEAFLLKPETFMNLSGQAVGPFMKYYGLKLEDLVVVTDDLDLPLGTVRLRPFGSSGGHNGLKSIIEVLGTEQFTRLKLGISRPAEPISVMDWVLMRFSSLEMDTVQGVCDRAVKAIRCVLDEGVERAMSQHNG